MEASVVKSGIAYAAPTMLRGIAGSIVLAAVCAAALSACGASNDAPGSDDEQQVRATLARFGTASAQRDYTAVCKDLLADTLIAKIRSVGIPCEVAIRTGLSDVQKPTLTVTSVRVTGSAATAVVRSDAKGQKPSTDLVRLVKQRGDWRLASLAEPEPSKARPRPEPEKAAPKKSAPEKAAPKKSAPKKAAPKKAAPKKAAPKKAAPKKAAPDKS